MRGSPERHRGFLDIAIQILQHRLHRADDEGYADEYESDDDAGGA
jgi:hypothetical protein